MAKVILTSRIFDKTARRQIIGAVPREQAKAFNVKTRKRLSAGPHTGRVYKKKRGVRQTHRASAKGQRPAVETGTLLNAISDKSTGAFRARTFVAEKANPANGTLASDYAYILQKKLDRPIMTESDAEEEQGKMNARSQVAIGKLI